MFEELIPLQFLGRASVNRKARGTAKIDHNVKPFVSCCFHKWKFGYGTAGVTQFLCARWDLVLAEMRGEHAHKILGLS